MLPTPTSTIVLLPGPNWHGWAARYASRGYDVREPALAQVEPLVRALEQPPIVMGPRPAVQSLVESGVAVAGVALVRLPSARRRPHVLSLWVAPGRRAWERAADRALAWAAEAADR